MSIHQTSSSHTPASLWFLGCLLATQLAAAAPAWSQIAAHASTATTSPEAQLKSLREELSALEGRVHELEKKAEDVKNNDDESEQAKKVEQRLAAIEKAQAKLEAEEAGKERSEKGEDAALSHAKAPFVVYDDDGHVIFRVGLNPSTQSPRITLGNAVGAHVVISANDEVKSSSIRMYGGNNTEDSDVLLLAGELSLLQLKSSEADRQTILGSGKDDRYGLFLSRGDIGSAALTSTDTGSGRLEIANSKGDIVAQGGAKPNGIGIFLTGPSCCSPPGALGPHQYILGRQ